MSESIDLTEYSLARAIETKKMGIINAVINAMKDAKVTPHEYTLVRAIDTKKMDILNAVINAMKDAKVTPHVSSLDRAMETKEMNIINAVINAMKDANVKPQIVSLYYAIETKEIDILNTVFKTMILSGVEPPQYYLDVSIRSMDSKIVNLYVIFKKISEFNKTVDDKKHLEVLEELKSKKKKILNEFDKEDFTNLLDIILDPKNKSVLNFKRDDFHILLKQRKFSGDNKKRLFEYYKNRIQGVLVRDGKRIFDFFEQNNTELPNSLEEKEKENDDESQRLYPLPRLHPEVTQTIAEFALSMHPPTQQDGGDFQVYLRNKKLYIEMC